MADEPNPRLAAAKGTTILEHVRPTIVVRRRIIEVAPAAKPPPALQEEDDESGPPSSVNVARALASLRADELKRVEELVAADDDDDEDPAASAGALESEPFSEVPEDAPPRPQLLVGPSISLAELARRVSMSREELAGALVTRGFFAMTTKASIPRDTVREIARCLGWQLEVTPEPDDVAPVKSGRRPKASKAKPASSVAPKKKKKRKV